MDISSILDDNKPADTTKVGGADASGLSTVPTDITNDGSSDAVIDPLSTYSEDGKQFEFNINSTISTSDKSPVGGYDAVQNTEPAETPEPSNVADDKPVVKPESDFVITDPAKMDFVKTYTKEYDDMVVSATHAVELILKSIDKTVTDHSNDIVIPEEATPFLDQKPDGGKVGKFDDAQQIVRTIMGKATEAKQQAEQAAKEAAQIYDGIQQFKKDTKQQIEGILSRDEFGRPKKGDAKTNLGAADTTNISGLPNISKL